MRAGFWDHQTIGVPCANCGRETAKSIAWLKGNDQLVCDECGAETDLQYGSFLRVIEEAEKAVEELGLDIDGLRF